MDKYLKIMSDERLDEILSVALSLGKEESDQTTSFIFHAEAAAGEDSQSALEKLFGEGEYSFTHDFCSFNISKDFFEEDSYNLTITAVAGQEEKFTEYFSNLVQEDSSCMVEIMVEGDDTLIYPFGEKKFRVTYYQNSVTGEIRLSRDKDTTNKSSQVHFKFHKD